MPSRAANACSSSKPASLAMWHQCVKRSRARGYGRSSSTITATANGAPPAGGLLLGLVGRFLLLELLAQVGGLVGAPGGGALARLRVGLVGLVALGALALDLLEPELLGGRIGHGGEHYSSPVDPLRSAEAHGTG